MGEGGQGLVGGLGGQLEGYEATDTQLPYDPRDTGHSSSLIMSKPVLNVALSSPTWAIECFIGWFGSALPPPPPMDPD